MYNLASNQAGNNLTVGRVGIDDVLHFGHGILVSTCCSKQHFVMLIQYKSINVDMKYNGQVIVKSIDGDSEC